jgi:hypothetical protein
MDAMRPLAAQSDKVQSQRPAFGGSRTAVPFLSAAKPPEDWFGVGDEGDTVMKARMTLSGTGLVAAA